MAQSSNGAVMDAVSAGNAAGTFASGQLFEGFSSLFEIEGVATTQGFALDLGHFTAFCGTFDNSAALIFGNGRKQRHEASAGGRGEIELLAIQHFYKRPHAIDAVDDRNPIQHRAGRPIPLGDDQGAASRQGFESLFQLGTVVDALA